MSESAPRPNYGEGVVRYVRVLDPDERWERHQDSEPVEIPVDEIHTLYDEELQRALWRKHRAETEEHPKVGFYVTAKPDGSFLGMVSAPVGELRFPPREERATEYEATAPSTSSGRFARRLFGRIFG